ncbi:hypothetical protein ACJIZ3_011957 [Penstemon smallii]|uniref:non-specific serine/threonine protein kinase n=1 Tax=Penstemon smallii TaxID=265156 RepID=A0ABD3UP75_9LAMI
MAHTLHHFLLFIIIILFPLFTLAQNNGNITVGTSLTATENSSPWLSPSGDFAFGFQQLQDNNDLFQLSIWFNRIPDRTIVWYQRGTNPVPRGSTLQLDAAGLLLRNPQGRLLWNTNGLADEVAYATLNNTGNFVLLRSDSTWLWESFRNPSDTILPTQTIEIYGMLVSRKTQTNFSEGRFYARMLEDGNFVLNTRSVPSNIDFDDEYYNSQTSDVNASNSGYQVLFNERASISIRRRNGQQTILSLRSIPPASDFYYRATLEFYGVFTQYYHPRSFSGNPGWTPASSWPTNICLNIDGDKGSGACGYNSVCRLENQRPVCQCPQGFSLADPNNVYGDCNPRFVPNCVSGENGSNSHELLEITDTDWPMNDYEQINPTNIDNCRTACLNDCLCAVAIFRSNSCWKKKLPLSNGRVDSSLGATAFLKFRRGDIPLLTPSVPIPSNQTRDQKSLIIVGSVLLGSSVFINFILIGAACLGFFLIYSKKIPFVNQVHSTNLRCFTYKELVQATNGFEEELGRGAFGIVYKGDVPDGSKAIVAVKKLDRVAQDTEKEFRAEVNAIGQTHHKNLVRLIGFCDEGPNRLLVYEIIFAILILLPVSTIAQTNLNITLGSSIVANRSNSTWLSPSGEFAFGFQQIVPGGYLLAIWFNNIPERTIVWSANRDNLAEEGSIIQLLQDGRFELENPGGQRIWAANLAGPRVAYAAMLDIGNFVLASNTSRVVWQSFGEPTDTLLPGQPLNQGGDLVASFSETNYSSGRFMFAMQTNGNLVFYTRNFPMNDNIFAYNETQTVGSGYQVVFNQSGYIFLVASNGTILSSLFSDSASSSQYYQRAILEYDGVLRHYVYPRFANSTNGRAMGWSVSNFLPRNICTRMEGSTGPGACGFNSFCSLGTDQRPNCRCPYGYSLVDPNDSMSGCKPSFVPQSCDRELNETGLFSFIEMLNTDWPDSDYDHFDPVNEDWCRQACLDDCFCAVAIYRSSSCWKKRFPLSNGRRDSSVEGKALIKIRSNNATANTTSCNQQNRKDRSTLIITGSTLLGSSVFLNLLLLSSLLFFVCYNQRKPKILQPSSVLPGVNIRSFSLTELQEATNGFKEELGSGNCSTVGYVAPEWFRNMPISVKVDVYSFGILLLELICCRRNVQTDVENENEEILSYWAYDCYKDRTLKLLVADDEEANHDIKQFEKLLMISLWCIQEDPSLRPNMKRVLHMLEGSVEVPIPPNPESFTSIS